MRMKAFLPPPHAIRLSHLRKYSVTPNCTKASHAPPINLRHSAAFLRTLWQFTLSKTEFPTAIDATAGRGSDTLHLAHLIGKGGTVHAIDIQQAALNETLARYETAQVSDKHPLATLHLHNACHSNLSFLAILPRKVSIITYNLGWYPGSDRTIVTKVDTTLQSLKCAEPLVAIGGLISVMCYVGHKGGASEFQAVAKWAASLPVRTWNVQQLSYPNRTASPILILAERLS